MKAYRCCRAPGRRAGRHEGVISTVTEVTTAGVAAVPCTQQPRQQLAQRDGASRHPRRQPQQRASQRAAPPPERHQRQHPSPHRRAHLHRASRSRIKIKYQGHVLRSRFKVTFQGHFLRSRIKVTIGITHKGHPQDVTPSVRCYYTER